MSIEQQQSEEERRSADEMRCPLHPDRPVVDPYVGTKQCCEECFSEKLARGAEYRPRDWSAGSDYTLSGRDLYCATTRGNVHIHTFGPGEKIR